MIDKSALVPYSTEQMFNLVDDIDSYPEFLPGCSRTETSNRTEKSVDGVMHLMKGGIKLELGTHNEMTKNKEIKLRLIKGPFKRLTGVWTFSQLREDACKVSLKMEFEFSSKILSMALSVFFNQLTNSMLDAFCKRAKDVYKNDGEVYAV
ncbi:type II toxin-antitoxin system RatA family toxin [Francisellaceae bacterium]|nr:type II toxin-antitoxin system RatA family toxin [Francisellaceae bacterium]